MKNRLILFVSIILLLGSQAFAQGKKKHAKDEKPVFQWYTLEKAMELNKKNPKKIFIDIYTDWCGWCKRMDSTTFKDSTLRVYLAANFYPVKFNAERADSIVFAGKTYKNLNPGKPRSTHQLTIKLLQGQLSYPSYVVLNSQLALIKIEKGYKIPSDMLIILKYIGGDAYKTKSFEEFKKENTVVEQ